MFTLELARRLTGTGVTANCLNPGFNTTGLGRELRFAAPLEKILTRLIRPPSLADDPGLQARLWRDTERILDG
ncbi:hypothetical protein [Herbidospora mongoliensis]|uniref:hypothetical protein n=1 Tax=Herbidospora mongoliensis TaxID=688067 RepID=UPI0009FC17D7|nr:hypothetical protein [Herbidospora mongoliensis]